MVVKNIQRYCVKSIDTGGKEHPIFLIIGDFVGNVLMFNNALNSTLELIYFIEDIHIFKVQTNINEDWQVFKTIDITLTGTADLQVIFGPFVQPLSKKDNAGQSTYINSRPFKHLTMYFNTNKTWSGRTNVWHTEEEWVHALMDAC
jgi:hypothetical protein